MGLGSGFLLLVVVVVVLLLCLSGFGPCPQLAKREQVLANQLAATQQQAKAMGLSADKAMSAAVSAAAAAVNSLTPDVMPDLTGPNSVLANAVNAAGAASAATAFANNLAAGNVRGLRGAGAARRSLGRRR